MAVLIVCDRCHQPKAQPVQKVDVKTVEGTGKGNTKTRGILRPFELCKPCTAVLHTRLNDFLKGFLKTSVTEPEPTTDETSPPVTE